MSSLSVRFGSSARSAFCAAFDGARESIDAEFYSIGDPAIIGALNRAASRGIPVRIIVEGDPRRYSKRRGHEPDARELRAALDPRIDLVVSHAPDPLVHGKAVVIDRAVSLIATANATISGFDAPGDAVIIDSSAADAAQVGSFIERARLGEPVPAGRSQLRAALRDLFCSSADVRIAAEDLSDNGVVRALEERAWSGHHDRVLVGPHPSPVARRCIRALEHAGVAVRRPAKGYMHEKFVDSGDAIYVGSANLTWNGIDESHEIGLVAAPSDFDDGAAALRADFERQWAGARPALKG